MKPLVKIYHLSILVIILLSSCEKQPELTQYTITGTIENYDPTNFDSIICMDYQLDSNNFMISKYHKLGKCDISKNGTFNVVLIEPLYTDPILKRIDRRMVITDSTAVIGYSVLQAYKNGNVVGYVIKCNEMYVINSLLNNNSRIIYTNKDLTINGIINWTLNSSTTYHWNLKKGWNEVVYTYKVTTNGMTTTMSMEATNSTTEDLKWRFIKY